MSLQEIKQKFDDLWNDCWEAAEEYEESNPELYDELSSLAIDCEERKNKMDELIYMSNIQK